jgi:hypothetical protein
MPVLLVIMRLAAPATAVARRPDGHPTDRYPRRYAGVPSYALALGGCHHVHGLPMNSHEPLPRQRDSTTDDSTWANPMRPARLRQMPGRDTRSSAPGRNALCPPRRVCHLPPPVAQHCRPPRLAPPCRTGSSQRVVSADNRGMTARCWTCGRFVGACRDCGARYCARCQPMQHDHSWEPKRKHQQARRRSLWQLLAGRRLRPEP